MYYFHDVLGYLTEELSSLEKHSLETSYHCSVSSEVNSFSVFSGDMNVYTI